MSRRRHRPNQLNFYLNSVFNPADYHCKWGLIRRLIVRRAGGVCEWCGARDRHPHPITASTVYLAVAHLDRDRAHNRFWNLAALCQRCHLAHDRVSHALHRRIGREWARDQYALGFPAGELLEALHAGRAVVVPAARVRARLLARPVRTWPRPQLAVLYPAPTLFILPPALSVAELRGRRIRLAAELNA